jgi:hypothetical protein
MITVIDAEAALRAAAAGKLTCPDCGGKLRRWSNARTRTVRLLQGLRATLTPPRLRCRACGRTHVVHAVQLAPRHAYGTEVVHAALLAAAAGRGHRTVAAELGLPADTVRGWLRRAHQAAEAVRIQAVQLIVTLDQDRMPRAVRPSRLGEALDALGIAAHLVAQRWKIRAPLWQVAHVVTRGSLLAASSSG